MEIIHDTKKEWNSIQRCGGCFSSLRVQAKDLQIQPYKPKSFFDPPFPYWLGFQCPVCDKRNWSSFMDVPQHILKDAIAKYHRENPPLYQTRWERFKTAWRHFWTPTDLGEP